MGWDGMEWDGMGWDGMGWDGMGWGGIGWGGVRWDGMGWGGMGRDGIMGACAVRVRLYVECDEEEDIAQASCSRTSPPPAPPGLSFRALTLQTCHPSNKLINVRALPLSLVVELNVL